MDDGSGEDVWLGARHEGGAYRRIEVITGRRARRSWSAAEKAAIVAASAEAGANISDVARRFGVNRGLLTVWRRQAGVSAVEPGPVDFVPIALATEGPRGEAVGEGGDGVTGPAAGGRIELDIGDARLVITGSIDPDLAGAVVAALARRR